jgi:exosortase/archaeosortase family protein
MNQSRISWRALFWIVTIGVLTLLLFAPLLAWLGRVSLQVGQLTTGGVLVLVALVICLRGTLATLRFEPRLSQQGVVLLAWGLICLGLTGPARRWALPLALLSFCLCSAAVIAFLFGRLGVRQFLPAIGAFFVFGLFAGIFPTLDWPLRAIAGQQAANVLAILHVPVQLQLAAGRPAELVLQAGDRRYIVATECNGIGLLTSAVLVATILAFQERLPWLSKFGLVALAIPIAIVGNFLRIVGIALVAPRVPLAYGFIHEAVGLVFYGAGLAAVWWTARRSAIASRPENAPC